MNSFSRGKYKVKIQGQSFETANTGMPMFVLLLIILGRFDENGDLQECQSEERAYRQALANDASIAILLGDLRSIGVQVSDLTDLHPSASKHVNLVGMEVSMLCELEDFNGRTVERWTMYRPTLDLEAVRGLQQQFAHVFQNKPGTKKAADVANKA